MARKSAKIILSPSRDIAFDRLILSQSNVRRVKAGVSIEALAEDIARRTLLQSLNVRPVLDADGQETGRFEIPAGGRRYRALELLVKQKRLAKNAPVPCVVRVADDEVLAEEDSLAENSFREQLHPLDEFRAMQSMVEKNAGIEEIAARFRTTPASVRQRLKLASVSPKLLELYADDAMTLDQLMAFSVSNDHARQEETWEQLEHSFNKSPDHIRQKLTEDCVRASDKRARFVTVDAYVAAGGGVTRDLFEADGGGWLTDPSLLDRLVDEKLKAESERMAAEGWKWVATALDLPWDATRGMRVIAGEQVPMTPAEKKRLAALEAECDDLHEKWAEEREVPEEVHARLDAIDAETRTLADRPHVFDPADMAAAGAFVSIGRDGTVHVERGFVKPEDEPKEGSDEAVPAPGPAGDGDEGAVPAASEEAPGATGEQEEEGESIKPLSDRLVSDLTAWRTLALQDALAQSPATTFAAVLHALVLGCFYSYSHDTCLQISANRVYFSNAPTALRDCAPAQAIDARARTWKERLPDKDGDLWAFLLTLDDDDQASLFAHCASTCMNAQAEVLPKYDNGRVSARSVAGRIAHSHVIARAVEFDMIGAGWRPTAGEYFRSVTKARILADVAEARGEQFAQMIAHLKKGDMAREAERLLEDAVWLPEPLRTPDPDGTDLSETVSEEGHTQLPAFLADEEDQASNGDAGIPIAAE